MEELTAKVAPMIEGNELEGLAMEFHFEATQMKPNRSSKPTPIFNFKPTLNPSHSGERSQDQSGICVLFLHFVLIEVLKQSKPYGVFGLCF